MFDYHKIIMNKKMVRVISYDFLKEISDTKILIDNNLIIGLNLKIEEMDDYSILIMGEIKEVKILEEAK